MQRDNHRNVDDISRADERESRHSDHRDGEEFHESLAQPRPLVATDTNGFVASILLVVAGVWLIIAPYVINYSSNSQATWNDMLVGIAVAVIALANMGLRRGWLSWLNFLLGVWLIVAPFLLSYNSVGGTWNDVLTGIAVCILAAWAGSGVNDEEEEMIR